MALTDAFRHPEKILDVSVAKWRQWCGKLAMLAAVAISVGCAGGLYMTAGASPESKAAAVRDRADARWKALIAGNVDEAYGYLSPASREVTTLEQFKAKTRTGSFRAISINAVQCEAEICKVKLDLTYDHRMMKSISTPVEETWILDRGQFWYVFRG